MDHILTNSSSLTTTKTLHVCRLYLQVTIFSDITALKGDTLLTTSLQGIRDKNQPSAYAWPRQQYPNEYSWKLWKLMLRTIYCSSSSNFLKKTISPQEVDQMLDSLPSLFIFPI